MECSLRPFWVRNMMYQTNVNMQRDSQWSSFITIALTCRLTCIGILKVRNDSIKTHLSVQWNFDASLGSVVIIGWQLTSIGNAAVEIRQWKGSLISTIAFQISVGGYLLLEWPLDTSISPGPLLPISTIIETGDIKGKWVVVCNTGICHGILFDTWGHVYRYGLTLIPVGISNHMHSNVLYAITYKFANFNGCTDQDWEWISNFNTYRRMDVITYPCRD